MTERELLKRGLYGRFKEIKRLAELFLRGEVDIRDRDIVILIEEYNSAVESLYSLKDKVGRIGLAKISREEMEQELVGFALSRPVKDILNGKFREIIDYSLPLRPLLIRILTSCEEALNILESIAWPKISQAAFNILRGLRDSLAELEEKGLDSDICRNILKAISECEEGHYLASALIASRPIIYMIEQMGGNRPTEKIVKMLVDVGLIPKDRKDEQRELLMAVRTARNFLAHRVDVYAGPDDALLLLGASVKLARIYLKWLQKER